MKRKPPARKPKRRISRARVNFWTGIGAAGMSVIGGLAALPYTLGDISTLIPPDWKAKVTGIGFISAFILRVINSVTGKA